MNAGKPLSPGFDPHASLQSDVALINRIRQGDATAYPELVARFERRVLGTLFGLTGNLDVAEELAQDTFVTAYYELSKLRDPAAFGSWLLGIARNRYREWLRDQKRRHAVEADESLPSPKSDHPTATGLSKAELFKELFRILSELPDPYGELLRLRYFEGLACKDIAQRLGRPLNTVTKQLSRAHALVADKLSHLQGYTTTLAIWLPKSNEQPHDTADVETNENGQHK